MKKKKPVPAFERKRKERANKRVKGLVAKEIWVYPEHWPEIDTLIKKLKASKEN